MGKPVWTPARIALMGFPVIFCLVYLFNSPNPYFLAQDDWIWMPEKAFFSSEGAWLKHLLFFNQNRFTYVGDFMLVRPGLFFFNWLMDLFRSHREVGYFFSLGIFSFSSAVFFYLTLRRTNLLASVLMTCFLVMYAPGAYLATWPHIATYSLACSLYCLGVFLVENKGLSMGPLSFACLLLSFQFHELAFCAVAGLIVLYILGWRVFSTKKTSFLKDLIWATPFVIQVVFVAGVFLLLGKGIFTPGEGGGALLQLQTRPWEFVKDFASHYLHFLSSVFHFFPIKILEGTILAHAVSLTLLLVALVSGWMAFRKKQFAALAYFVVLITILFGIAFGRILTRGEASPWYGFLAVYGFLLLMTMHFSRHPKVYMVVLVALVSIQSFRVIEYFQFRGPTFDDQESDVMLAMIDTLRRTLATEKSSVRGLALLNEPKEIISANKRGSFFLGGHEALTWNYATGMLFNLGWGQSAPPGGPTGLLYDFERRESHVLCFSNLISGPWNPMKKVPPGDGGDLIQLPMYQADSLPVVESHGRLVKSDIKTQIQFVVPGSWKAVSARVTSSDKVPILYNFLFAFKGAHGGMVFAFDDTVLVVLERGLGPSKIAGSAYLCRLTRSPELVFHRENGRLTVWVDGSLVFATENPVGISDWVEIQFGTWTNGTPGETLSQVVWTPQ